LKEEERRKEEERKSRPVQKKEEEKTEHRPTTAELDKKWKEQQEQEERNADLERTRLEEDRQRRIEEARKRSTEVKEQRKLEDKKTYSAYTATMTITFRALNKKGVQKKTGGDADQFSAFGNGQKIAKIDDMGNGTYSFEYKCIPGNNIIDIKFQGKSIKGFPISFKRKSENELMEERAQEASFKAKEEEDRLREEERIREEASRLLDKERQRQEQQRRLREEDHARDYRLARDAEIRAKKEEELKRSGENVELNSVRNNAEKKKLERWCADPGVKGPFLK